MVGDTGNELQNHKQNYEHKYISAMLKTLYKNDSIIPQSGLSHLLMYHQQIHMFSKDTKISDMRFIMFGDLEIIFRIIDIIISPLFEIVTADCAYHD
jgi:hypothetical protein